MRGGELRGRVGTRAGRGGWPALGIPREPLRPLLWQSARVGVVYLVGQVPAFFVPAVIAVTFGATTATDTFFLAFAVATFVVNSVNGAAQAAVPYLVAQGEAMLRRATWLLAAVALSLYLAAALLLGPLIDWVTPAGVGPQGLVRAFLVALVPFVLVSGVAAIWASAGNARRDYVGVAWTQAVRALVTVGLVMGIGAAIGVWLLVVAFLAGELARAGFLLWRLSGARGGRCPSAADRAAGVTWREFDRSVIAQTIGSALLGLVPIVDRTMASWLGPGSVSVLEYAERLALVPSAVAMMGFAVVSLSEWSRGDHDSTRALRVARQAAATSWFVSALTLPFCLAFLVVRKPITRVLFGGGQFPPADLSRLADTVAALVAGLPLQLIAMIYARAALALRQSLFFGVVAGAEALTKIVLNFALLGRWGIVGLALATSAMHGLGAVALPWWCRRETTRTTGRDCTLLTPF